MATIELPDPAICRAMLYGKGGLVECLVQHPLTCAYAMTIGTGSFCKHPQRFEIAARTKAEQEKKKS